MGVMILKSIVGLFLVLVIQLSQVQACPATESNPSCPAVAASAHDCCKEKTSCPCVSERKQAPQPIPAAPAPVDLKLSAPKVRELDFLALFFLPKISEAVPATASFPESHRGFTGVPLSVAFCSFVI